MASVIHFRFRSDKEFGTIKFDGSSLSMGDLKLEIVRQKKLNNISDTDLIISDAQTGEGKKSRKDIVLQSSSNVFYRIQVRKYCHSQKYECYYTTCAYTTSRRFSGFRTKQNGDHAQC
jgi:hypothetical protein